MAAQLPALPKKPTKHKLEANKKKKDGEKAVIFLKPLNNPGEVQWLTRPQVAKFNSIVRNEKRSRFLPKKAKDMIKQIYDDAAAETKNKLMQL